MDLKATDFLIQWFGPEGRELGTPERRFITNYRDLIAIIEECKRKLLPCYLSVQPYRARDQPSVLEKMFSNLTALGILEGLGGMLLRLPKP